MDKEKSIGRPKRKVAIPQADKTYIQESYAKVLPIEDFYPGCVVSLSQLLPGDIDVKKVIEAASLGMRNSQIAALVGCSTETLLKHFPKTIARVRAEHAMKLLGLLNLRAEDMDAGKRHDFQALMALLDRQDPEPPKAPMVVQLQPLPREVLELEATVVTEELKQLKNKKESN